MCVLAARQTESMTGGDKELREWGVAGVWVDFGAAGISSDNGTIIMCKGNTHLTLPYDLLGLAVRQQYNYVIGGCVAFP